MVLKFEGLTPSEWQLFNELFIGNMGFDFSSLLAFEVQYLETFVKLQLSEVFEEMYQQLYFEIVEKSNF